MILGAIIGDIVGSRFEYDNLRKTDIKLFDFDSKFTDDSVMTCAIAESLVNGNVSEEEVASNMRKWYRKYPYRGYGGNFRQWCLNPDAKAYNSWGNGSAMRTSSVAYFANSLDECKDMARKYAGITHNHPEGMKGAEAVSVAIWLALNGESQHRICEYIEQNYYDLNFDYDDLVQNYEYDVSCQGSVPQAIYCFLRGNSFEECIRIAVSIGGDSDTIACITGAIAEAYFGIPEEIKNQALKYVGSDMLKLLEKTEK